jgi:4,5-dihydroxyphthalate decarboxylase
MSLPLSIAVAPYDRTLPLMAGLISIKGITPTFVTAPLEEIFARAFDEQAFDVTELSFSNYLYLTATTGCPYVGLPIFPSRAFRHSAVYIRTDRGIRGPRDLVGCIVGVREFSMTAALVGRGVLQDDFGLRASEVHWRYGPADRDDPQPSCACAHVTSISSRSRKRAISRMHSQAAHWTLSLLISRRRHILTAAPASGACS